jgi:L-ascorbate metabolism protein UlaG (beta-lactamase superfamily)
MVTMDAKEGIEMMQIINAEVSIPIHYDDYDVFKSPLSDFQRAVREAGLERRVHYLNRGDTYKLAVKRS